MWDWNFIRLGAARSLETIFSRLILLLIKITALNLKQCGKKHDAWRRIPWLIKHQLNHTTLSVSSTCSCNTDLIRMAYLFATRVIWTPREDKIVISSCLYGPLTCFKHLLACLLLACVRFVGWFKMMGGVRFRGFGCKQDFFVSGFVWRWMYL